VNSPIKWHGGKHYLAKQINALMGEHLHYVETHGGGLNVLLHHDFEGRSEVANDLDYKLTNFWRVLQRESLFAEFRRTIEAMPFSQVEWEDAINPPFDCNKPEPCVKCALDFFVSCRQSLAGRMKSFAPLSKSRVRRGMSEQASAWLTTIAELPQVHHRLQRVVIKCEDAFDCIRTEDSLTTLFYCDPPYVPDTRASKTVYKHEYSLDQHEQLLWLLGRIKGKAIISGYDCDLYARMLKDWYQFRFEVPNHAAGGDGKRVMVECLWLNYQPLKVTHAEREQDVREPDDRGEEREAEGGQP